MNFQYKNLFTAFISFVIVVGFLSTFTNASPTPEADRHEPEYIYTNEDYDILYNDIFAKINSIKEKKSKLLHGSKELNEQDYTNLIPQVIKAVQNSETYINGTLQQNNNFLVWETTVGIPCCYSPRMEAEKQNTKNTFDSTSKDRTTFKNDISELLLGKYKDTTIRNGPTSLNIGLIQPYWDSPQNYKDMKFNNYSPYYKEMYENLLKATGGKGMRYTLLDATVDRVAETIQECGLVLIDSHGATDYEGKDKDYTSRANCSYLRLSTSYGITYTDTKPQSGPYGTYYHAMVGSDYALVSGTCIANHMKAEAPNSLVYMGICLGMATDGMAKGLRNKGVDTVFGYSKTVSFEGEFKYMKSIIGYILDGDDFASALSKTKSELGNWDPFYSNYTESEAIKEVAFPIVVSSKDPYPGHGHVDEVQEVHSSWALYPFEVTVIPNNMNYGSVKVMGYSFTANPNDDYYATNATVISGTAIVNQTDRNTFIVNPTSNCIVQLNFAPKVSATVNYIANGVLVNTTSSFLKSDVILPDSTIVPKIEKWNFVGWMTNTLSMTTKKPDYFKSGQNYTVNSVDVTFYALYTHKVISSDAVYELVTKTPEDWNGIYVISSSTNSNMYVINGMNGDINIEKNKTGFKNFSSTKIILKENENQKFLSNVMDVYKFQVSSVNQDNNDVYSFQSLTEGSYLAIYEGYLWILTNYNSNYCNWNMNDTGKGVMMTITDETNYSYLNFKKNQFKADTNGRIQLWKENFDSTLYYWTDPVIELTPDTPAIVTYVSDDVEVATISTYLDEDVILPNSSAATEFEDWTFMGWIPKKLDLTTEKPVYYEPGQNFTVNSTKITFYALYSRRETKNDLVHYWTAPKKPATITYVSNGIPVGTESTYLDENIILPTSTTIAAEIEKKWSFVGWASDAILSMTTEKPFYYESGQSYTVKSVNVTLYALFTHMVVHGDSSSTFYELVTKQPEDWKGNYVITSTTDSNMVVMNGMNGDVDIERYRTGYTIFANTDIILEENKNKSKNKNTMVLRNVNEQYLFYVDDVNPGNDVYTFKSVTEGSYLAIYEGYVWFRENYNSNYCNWNINLSTTGNGVMMKISGKTDFPYLYFKNDYFTSNSSGKLQLWKEILDGDLYYWTDPVVDEVETQH